VRLVGLLVHLAREDFVDDEPGIAAVVVVVAASRRPLAGRSPRWEVIVADAPVVVAGASYTFEKIQLFFQTWGGERTWSN
jgi:hypothetical protein